MLAPRVRGLGATVVLLLLVRPGSAQEIQLGGNVSQRGLRSTEIVVDSVKPGDVASRMGIKAGDVLYKVNNLRINSIEQLKRSLKQGSLEVIWRRGDKYFIAKAYWSVRVIENPPPPTLEVDAGRPIYYY